MMFALWPPLGRRVRTLPRGRRVGLAVLLLAATLGPDVDLLFGLVADEPIATYHNGFTHSLVCVAGFAILFGLICRVVAGFGLCFFIWLGGFAYFSHIAIDVLSWGRGVQLFWPMTETRFDIAPFYLFMGVRHSVDAPWTTHLLTVLNDTAFAVVVWLVCKWWYRRKVDA